MYTFCHNCHMDMILYMHLLLLFMFVLIANASDHGVILNILFSRKMDDDLQTFLQQHLVSDIMLK